MTVLDDIIEATKNQDTFRHFARFRDLKRLDDQVQTFPRIVSGWVNTAGAGTIVQGTGFTIVRNGIGDISVTWPAFPIPPKVTLGANSDSAVMLVMPTITGVRILLRNLVAGAFVATDAQFCFDAIGQV